MKLESFEADNVEFGKVTLRMILDGLQDALNCAKTLNSLVGEDIDIKVEKHHKKRSLNANSYERVLEGKIADALGTSKDEVHNLMLARYGQYERDKAGNIVFVLAPASKDYSKEPDIHLKPTGRSEDRNGEAYYWYATMKPSHTLDSKEFAQLLDGVISEARELDIEILSEDEIRRMEASYERGK